MYSSYANSNSAMGALMGMGAGAMVVWIALLIFGIVCMWKVFVKAGEPGWKCLIPIYNAYIFYKIAWEAKYFVWMILGVILASVIMGIGMGSNSGGLAGIGSFLMMILYAAIFVLAIIALVKLAKRFGKGAGFAVGLILLSIIFMAILAFDSSDYDRSRA